MRALPYLIPQEWAQLTGTCEHPKTSPGGRGSWLDPQQSWGTGTGPLWKHAPTFYTHTFSFPCILPSTAQGPREPQTHSH